MNMTPHSATPPAWPRAVLSAGLIGALASFPAAPLTAEPVSQQIQTGADMTAPYSLTVKDLSSTAARQLVDQGLEIAKAQEMALSFAVVDRAGNLLAFARMDGAPLVTIDVAIGKARTAAFIKNPSKAFEDMINSGLPSMATTPNLLPLQGGMPVTEGGEVIGAIGVSGSSGENDQAIAAKISRAGQTE